MSEKKSTAVKETAKPTENADLTTNTENNSVLENEATGAGADGFCVYIGPSIMGVIQAGTILKGTKNDVLKELEPIAKKHPLIESLIVSDKTLAVDRIKSKTPGNLLYVNYHRLLNGDKRGGI